ncbi:hypothetical protein HYV74_02235 [Candidatus Uhrbacteria bacterium]|nr:hypothetical protein [Candidatus Uhrbacteria bacterium]
MRTPETRAKPDDRIAYLVGKNGIFRSQRDMHFRAVIPTTELPMLVDVAREAEWLLPPIPAEITYRIVSFFRKVYAAHRTEAALHLCYHETRGVFDCFCSKQSVTPSHAEYKDPKPGELPEGFRCIGTVHSHASMGAFHSGTDQHDEQWFNGIHATVGRLDRPAVEIVAALAVHGERFTQPVERIFAGIVPVVEVAQPTPKDVEAQLAFYRAVGKCSLVEQRRWSSSAGGHMVRSAIREHWKHLRRYATTGTVSKTEGYRIELPPGVDATAWEPPDEWMTRVHPAHARPQQMAACEDDEMEDLANAVPSQWSDWRQGIEFDVRAAIPMIRREEIAPELSLTRRSLQGGRREGDVEYARLPGRKRWRISED